MATFSARGIVGGAGLFLEGLTPGAWYFTMSDTDVEAH